MGILNHRKTWRFDTSASAEECIAAFAKSFDKNGGGPVLMRANWTVARRPNGAAAIYQGRAGLAKGISVMSSRAMREQDSANGSEITFEVESGPGTRTICNMWLSSHGTGFAGLTADARFMRPYFTVVANQLRALDPSCVVQTG